MYCLSCEREVVRLKKLSFIQWFICLVRRDMKEFEREAREDPEIYRSVKDKLQDEHVGLHKGGKE